MSRFWGADGPAWPEMPLRSRDAGENGGSEDEEKGREGRHGLTAEFAAWVRAW